MNRAWQQSQLCFDFISTFGFTPFQSVFIHLLAILLVWIAWKKIVWVHFGRFSALAVALAVVVVSLCVCVIFCITSQLNVRLIFQLWLLACHFSWRFLYPYLDEYAPISAASRWDHFQFETKSHRIAKQQQQKRNVRDHSFVCSLVRSFISVMVENMASTAHSSNESCLQTAFHTWFLHFEMPTLHLCCNVAVHFVRTYNHDLGFGSAWKGNDHIVTDSIQSGRATSRTQKCYIKIVQNASNANLVTSIVYLNWSVISLVICLDLM